MIPSGARGTHHSHNHETLTSPQRDHRCLDHRLTSIYQPFTHDSYHHLPTHKQTRNWRRSLFILPQTSATPA